MKFINEFREGDNIIGIYLCKQKNVATTKNGKDMVAISIPNQDQNDKRPWEEFVLPVQMVHSDHYGSKSLWAKIPENGTTVLSRSTKPEDPNGSWTREERTVDNKTLKSMVEAYKLKPKTQGAR